MKNSSNSNCKFENNTKKTLPIITAVIITYFFYNNPVLLTFLLLVKERIEVISLFNNIIKRWCMNADNPNSSYQTTTINNKSHNNLTSEDFETLYEKKREQERANERIKENTTF